MARISAELIGKAAANPAKSGADEGEDWWAQTGASVTSTQNIEDIEAVWSALEETGIESPGQSLAFTKAWIEKFDIPRSEQLFVTGTANGKTIALMPLLRRREYGTNLLTWFHGSHVGCNMPILDQDAFGKLSIDERATLWSQMQRGMFGADMVYLHFVPELAGGEYFGALGTSSEVECLYRAEFDNWDACDKTQRTRSRRKHDKQQGKKLDAMGEVTFEEICSGSDATDIMKLLFAQKSVRFSEWGVEDPFADPEVQQFYIDIFNRSAPLDEKLTGKLHVLRLDGEIISIRYNLEHGDRMFAMISSMSDDESLRPGSPGKQNILRAMQRIFSSDHKLCDMGAGFSDEKRHWCNTTIALRNHYIPLTAKGRLVAKTHEIRGSVRSAVKANKSLFNLAKSARSLFGSAK